MSLFFGKATQVIKVRGRPFEADLGLKSMKIILKKRGLQRCHLAQLKSPSSQDLRKPTSSQAPGSPASGSHQDLQIELAATR